MTTQHQPLKGRTALVTGAGRGLGRTIAQSLADAGAHVWVASRNQTELDTLVSDIEASGGAADSLCADMQDRESLTNLEDQLAQRSMAIEILVNNAGINRKKPVVAIPDNIAGTQPGAGPLDLAMTDDDWNSILDTHVRGSLHLIRAFAPSMLNSGFGRIINIGSSSTLRTPDYCVPYQVAKGSLDHLTRGLAKEWAPYGITVNSIAPGHFRTSMTKKLHDSVEGQAWLRQRIPMRRTGDPAELGALAVHLASDVASFITGQTIYVDGGETL